MAEGYAGDVLPREAWRMLEDDPAAQLVDVRTTAEWAYVGLPRLEAVGREAICISWQVFPEMQLNTNFVGEIAARGLDKSQPILLLCRSGVRSKHAAIALTAMGFERCYNVAEGFEGDRDAELHRGRTGGWKNANLPWHQG